MCGIAGGFAFSANGQRYIDRIGSAIGCLSHRGPDGEGIFKEEQVCLGHRRLSIIDTSSAANQPMFSRDDRYCMIFNGEIFNYLELKKKYLSSFPFTTTSDTEVFLELYAMIGTSVFTQLRGFFAAAIYDKQEHTMVLVRDRYGKKPVHVFRNNEVILFASELKSLFSFGIPREIDSTALPYYFQLNYIPQPLSLVKGVNKLLPGHFLTIDKNGITDHQYYELKINTESYGKLDYDGAKDKLVELMDEATRLRLISDVPLGAFLSGGIDSSVVVALASRHQQKLKTFSIGYKDNPFFDETKYAKLVAEKYKTDHTVFSLGNNDFLEHIDDVLKYIDEPFADSSSIPTFILSRETRKHVTVALSGDGGDEVFAGYNKYLAEWRMMQPGVKGRLVKGLSPLWKLLPKSRSNRLTNTIRQLHRYTEAASLGAEERYYQLASMMPASRTPELFMNPDKNLPGLNQLVNSRISGKDLNEVLLADMNMVLPGDMLVKVDMMSMANSLEIRSPFIDQEVVDFAFGLPASYKINGDIKKRIVQDAFRNMLPPELYNRPKQGFDIPLLGWFRNELWSRIDKDLLSDKLIKEQGIFNPAAISNLKQKMKSANPEDSHETVWAMMVFQYWWRKYLA